MALAITKGDPLKTEVYPAESYLTGLFWSNPELYHLHPNEKINADTFGSDVWAFFFRVGRALSDSGINQFDDLSVSKMVEQLSFSKYYDKFGGYDTMQQSMQYVANYTDNFDGYFEEVQKYKLLRNLRGLFGDKIEKVNGKYDYHNMNADQIHKHWLDTINKLSFINNKFDEDFLLEGLEEAIELWDTSPSVGLEFFESPKMTRICTGWDYGTVSIFGTFSGRGKTAISMNKIFLSCIQHNEPILVIANEQSKEEFQKLLLVTAMGVGTKDYIKRQRLNEGGFSDEEKDKLKKAVKWVRDLSSGETRLVTFVFIEDYSIENVKNIIRHYAMRGIRRILIDTAKPTEGSPDMARWERFTEDFKELYKLVRPNGGGMNLALWANVQLQDAAIGRRFLNEQSLGDSKKIKNEASVLFLTRPVFDDEYEGGKMELECWYFVNEDGKPVKKFFKLNEEHGPFYVLFTAKNRRGQTNETGLDVLILKPDFNNNTWKEIGWCKVANDHQY